MAEVCCFHPLKADACFSLKKNMGIIDFHEISEISWNPHAALIKS